MLSPAEQFALHQFYEPTKELSPLELVEHRRRVAMEHPSLPQRAGRALTKVRPFLNLPAPHLIPSNATVHRSAKPKGHDIAVFSKVNPDLSPDRIVQVLIAMAKEQVRRDQAVDGSGHPPRAKS